MFNEANSHPESTVVDNGQGQVETTVTDNQEVDTQEAQTPEPQQAEPEAQAEENEYIETEFNGRLYNLPKELKDALLRQQDYTKKTMDLANQRKEFESLEQEYVKRNEEFEKHREEFQRVAQLRDRDFKKAAEIQNIEERLELYSQLDWNSLDPQQATQLDREERTLRDKREKLYRELAKSENERTVAEQNELARREADSARILQTEIPGWNAELQESLAKYAAKEFGATDKNIKQTFKYSPNEVKLLHKAYLFDQNMKQALSKPVKEVKPTVKVSSGTTNVSRDPAQMTQEEYSKWRQKRLSNK